MKIDPRRVGAFLRDPGQCGVILLYGDDVGLLRERSQALVRLAAGSTDDPFRVADLDRGDAERLEEEAASLSLVGGRRAVRLRDATDAATDAVQTVLARALPALVVIEAPGLAARSRLRQAVERAANGAAIGCYPESGQGLEQLVRDHLWERGVSITAEALVWTASRLGCDRASSRQELDKLALYVGAGARADLAAATACLGDLSGLSLEDALYAATAGEPVLSDRALGLSLAEGGTPVGVVRAALLHFQRLHRVCLLVQGDGAGGMSADEAVKSLRPPVFFRRASMLARAASRWSLPAVERALADLAVAELACKRTGAPAEAICRRAVLSLARRASRAG